MVNFDQNTFFFELETMTHKNPAKLVKNLVTTFDLKKKQINKLKITLV